MDKVLRIDKIDPELKKQVKVAAALAGMTMRDYIIEALKEKLNNDSKILILKPKQEIKE